VAKLVRAEPDAGKRVEELFLATVGRPPSAAELAACLKFVTDAGSPERGLQGVLWSLVNTREFLLQH
jgi:hypothetical protein